MTSGYPAVEDLHQICRHCGGTGDAHSLRCRTLQLTPGVPPFDNRPAFPQPGSTIPPERNGGLTGYVVGECGHRVYQHEWNLGFRNCERCGR